MICSPMSGDGAGAGESNILLSVGAGKDGATGRVGEERGAATVVTWSQLGQLADLGDGVAPVDEAVVLEVGHVALKLRYGREEVVYDVGQVDIPAGAERGIAMEPDETRRKPASTASGSTSPVSTL